MKSDKSGVPKPAGDEKRSFDRIVSTMHAIQDSWKHVDFKNPEPAKVGVKDVTRDEYALATIVAHGIGIGGFVMSITPPYDCGYPPMDHYREFWQLKDELAILTKSPAMLKMLKYLGPELAGTINVLCIWYRKGYHLKKVYEL
jgi:hypothetical protein